MLPVVVLVGRPNVGKSSLFNRIVRSRRAIVDDVPGVTRDRVVAPATHAGRAFLCVDTGGLAFAAAAGSTLEGRVQAQTRDAIGTADVIVCVLDGRTGLLPGDHETVRLLARSGRPVVYAVNKIDTARRDVDVVDFERLGVPKLLGVSAAHGRGLGGLLDAVLEMLPSEAPGVVETTTGTRIAILGRPNVGKSSLLNRLLGEERVVVAPEAGTTRDVVDTTVQVDGRPYVLIDTAGLRRRGRVRDPLEGHGAVRALGTLARSDLVLVVLDAAEGVTDQDARLIGRAWRAGRGVVLVANKWDTLPARARDVERFRKKVGARPAVGALPLLCVSARTGEGLDPLFPTLARVERAYAASLPTPALNRAIKAAAEAHRPPSPGGRPVRLLYATQLARRPPAVALFTSAPAVVPPAYVRYIESRLIEHFGLVGVPLRLELRARRAPGGPGRRRSRLPGRGTPGKKRHGAT